MKEESGRSSAVAGEGTPALSPLLALSLLSACGLGLAAGIWLGHGFYSVNLVSDPAKMLRSILVIECPIVILIFSLIRRNPSKCSYLKAVGRGLLGLPLGALVMAFGAITLGAPVSTKPTESTEYLLCLPAYGAVVGSWFGAWPMPLDWERPWQEWPICVTYGGIAGYVLGIIVSFGFILFGRRQQHIVGRVFDVITSLLWLIRRGISPSWIKMLEHYPL
ncbi:hypothetical protein V2J09_021886 [Rumex salicifolius]